MSATEDFDVVIVGAGLSGIGCACHLRRRLPHKSFVLLESREATGGTWDLFRYPGIRSDSDLHTYGYAFKPWVDDKAIAGGAEILDYIRETAREHDLDSHIRLSHRVLRADWNSSLARWLVEVQRTDTGDVLSFRCRWLFGATGYYRYDRGYTPEFEGLDRFAGTVVHPQQWPEDLDCADKQVVVIGSGATAVTLVPALAKEAAHVTQLQRSPTYIASVPERDPLAKLLGRLLPARRVYPLIRRKNIALQRIVYQLSQRRPRLMRALFLGMAKRQLPDGYPVGEHFSPSYNPWDQRLCAVPNGDFFRAIRRGSASVVTDRIATFTERGIRLESGRELAADIVVTATGLDLLALGGMELSRDGAPVDFAQGMVFKSVMLSDLPNICALVGYTNASWTLKVDLVCEYVCRLMAHMDEHGYDTCIAHNDDPTVQTRPLLDFGAGYVQRSVHLFPKQGTKAPWSVAMSYAEDVKSLRGAPVEDPALHFSTVSEHRCSMALAS